MKLIPCISLFTLLVIMNRNDLILNSRSYTKTIDSLQKDSLPPLPPAPQIKQGWVGTFQYKVQMKGGGNQPKPYSYFVNYNRVHTGYLELTRDVKGAIRVNQPDKYNAQRWESWIPEGSKKSWNYVNDSLHEVTVITADLCCLTPHDHFRTTRAGSTTAWQQGVLHGYDLQIDYTTGSFILSMPLVTCDALFTERWYVNKDAKAKNKYLRNVNESGKQEFKTYQLFNSNDTLMGSFQKGQQEIVLRRTEPLTYKSYLWYDLKKGVDLYITPFVKGTVEFELRLKRVGG
ncbi:MAG: hypothetical protein HEQ40_15085 [Lacibacter sp.]|jgi:hypothetical protein